MTAAAKKILDEALALPEEERRIVAEMLMDSLAAQQEKFDAAWRDEILRRIEQVRQGEVELESWDEVRRLGREALADRR